MHAPSLSLTRPEGVHARHNVVDHALCAVRGVGLAGDGHLAGVPSLVNLDGGARLALDLWGGNGWVGGWVRMMGGGVWVCALVWWRRGWGKDG